MERDDLIVNDNYALNAHHDEAHGKIIRKKIYFVTFLLSIITIFEVGMGIMFKRNETFTWTSIKWMFVALTLVKAGYIVMSFMHLGDERKNLRNAILAPYIIFIIYLTYIALTEGFANMAIDELLH
ncbi:MAG: cytochrome C oxidase subunit IV family protein [Flavobacteriales bacterium]|nr:cytochrome C oxidase subunit IV family protein [Flavobacteriales bacterium]